jgi:hypothetical protein
MALIDRAVSDSHADQKERHGSSGEEREFRVVPATKRARDSESDQGYHETDLPTCGPPRGAWHEPAQAQPEYAAKLEEHDKDLENRTDIESGSDHLTGSFLGTCLERRDVS